MKFLSSKLNTIACCVFLVGSIATASSAQVLTDVPPQARGIGVDEHLGETIPLDLVFEDDRGRVRRLDQIVNGTQPILLTLNYSNCPGLCNAQLDGLAEGVDKLFEVALGKDFQLVSISVDPRETRERAAGSKLKYSSGLDEQHDRNAWHFMTGSPSNIAAIAKSVGFRYTYDKSTDQYNHVAAAIAISPKGKITRYIYDVSFDPNTLRLALMEASEGKIGTTVDAFMLWCMSYSATDNRYSADARKLLAITAGVFVLLVLGASIPFWFRASPKVVNDDAANAGVETEMHSNLPAEIVDTKVGVGTVNDLSLNEVTEKLCSTSDR
jgi:protein SCO1